MRRTGFISLLAAVTALFVMAVGASAAFAGGTSEYKAEGGKNPEGITFEGKGTNPHFESASGSTVNCEKSTSKGKILGFTSAEVTVTYSGKCKISIGGKCENTSSETIVTEKLTSQPGDELGLNGTRGTKVGLLFTGNSSKELAKFKCEVFGGTVNVVVTGALVCENPEPGVLTEKGKVVCATVSGKHGEQQFNEINIKGKGILKEQELKSTGIFSTEKTAQITTEELTYNKKVEQTK